MKTNKYRNTNLGGRFGPLGHAFQLQRYILGGHDGLALDYAWTVRWNQDGQQGFSGPDGRFVTFARAHLALVNAVVVQGHWVHVQVVFAW